MNSEKFMFQNSLEANYLSIQLEPEDCLDEIAVKVIQKDCPDFLIPFRMVSVNEETSLKYKLINTVALEYAEMTLPKALFVQLYLNLLEPFVKGKDWFLDHHNFCVDARYVYVDKHTYDVFYIYVPVMSFRSTDEEILEFFRNAFMKIMISDDKDFQVRLFRFFGGGHITLAGLYQLMLGEKGTAASHSQLLQSQREPAMQATGQPVSQQFVSSQPIKPVENTRKEEFDNKGEKKQQAALKEAEVFMPYGGDNGEDEVVQALFGGKKPKKEKPSAESKKEGKDSVGKRQDEKKHGGFGGLFGGKKKSNAPVQPQGAGSAVEAGGQAAFSGGQQSVPVMNDVSAPVDYAAMYGGNSSGADETEVFSDDGAAVGMPWMELIDFSQPGALQRIDLNFAKPYIIIGRASSDEKRPDVVFPGEFKRIGRQHARIERRGNDLFVIDLGSANHTMLNGQVLVPNQPYQLQDGMELAFTVSKPVRYRVHI